MTFTQAVALLLAVVLAAGILTRKGLPTGARLVLLLLVLAAMLLTLLHGAGMP